MEMDKNSRIYVAGHRGMVGSALVRALEKRGFSTLILAGSHELDLRDSGAVRDFFRQRRPEYVFLSAAKVGGIQANISAPAEFLYDNVMIHTNVIHQAYVSGVKKLVVLGSSCIYPRECPQPMKEDYLLTGVLEPTNEGYALSKIVALKQAEYYSRQYGFRAISIMPPNLYGPGDHFDLNRSHVMSALVKRFSDAVDGGGDEITLWGTGSARREFLHVDDLSDAVLHFMEKGDGRSFVNVGWGSDVSIKELAAMVASKVGFKGAVRWDTSKPDGMPRKCMDVSLMRSLGFQPKIELERGVELMIDYYRSLKREGPVR
jgi:GDP-L-fucose synthase